MGIGIMIGKVINVVKGVGGNVFLVGKKYAPEIMIGTGIAGFALTIVQTVKATNKTNDILEAKETQTERCKKIFAEENDPKYTLIDVQQDLKVINTQTKWNIVKAWIPVGTCGLVSVILVLGGYRVLNGRYVATAAAYKALEAGFDHYRQNVIDEYGEDVDWRMRNNIKADEVEAERAEREKQADIRKDKKGKKKYSTSYQREAASAVFDQYSERWRRYWTPTQVWEYLKIVESEMNDTLNIRKHVFLNEVLDRLGLERTREGQVLGWIKTRGDSNKKISFGLDEMPEEARRDFLACGYNDDIWIRLHFNVDGMILNMIDKTSDILMG